jgi:uncharacterized protein (DUF1501 family)
MSKRHELCCDEYARARRASASGFSRRVFVRTGGLALVSWGFAPRFIGRALGATAPQTAGKKVLVCVFQRGAVDGLNMVVPHGDKEYYDARRSIAVPAPGRGDGRAIDLDGFFGLHPALAPLQPWYRDGHLAIVHAVGSPDATRSHFDAQDYMETGTPGVKTTPDGWLNRLLAETAAAEQGAPQELTRGIAVTQQEPRAMGGRHAALTVGDLQQFLGEGAAPARAARPSDEDMAAAGGNDMAGADMAGDADRRAAARRGGMSDRQRSALLSGFEALYGAGEEDLLLATGSEALDAVAFLKAADPLRYEAANGARYPRAGLGRQLQQVAQLIRADVGLEIAFTDIGGWDTHRQQGGAEGALAARLGELGEALAAFAQDLGDRMDDVVVLTMSEFGRTVEENGSAGTDHGHANAAMVLGGRVNGGRVYGEWPGLQPEQRYEGRDLAITTDFRDVFGEVADSHLTPRNPAALFPGHRLDRRNYKGLIRT